MFLFETQCRLGVTQCHWKRHYWLHRIRVPIRLTLATSCSVTESNALHRIRVPIRLTLATSCSVTESNALHHIRVPIRLTLATSCSVTESNAKNFHGSSTTVVRAQDDTSKTANITDTIFNKKINNT